MATRRLAAPAVLAIMLVSIDASAQAAPSPTVDPAATGAPSPQATPPPQAAPAPAPPAGDASGGSGLVWTGSYGPPGAAPAPPPLPELERPTSVERFKELRRELREELDAAEDDDRERDAEQIRRDLDDLEDWYREDTQRRSGGAMAGGIVMLGVGGLGVAIGGITLAVAGIGESLGGRHDGAQAAGATALLVGVGLIGGGIPLTIWGSKRVMVRDAAFGPSTPSHAALRVGPGSFAVEGSF